MEVPIESIHPSPYQPRLTFNIGDLKEEIERDGLLSALVVRRRDDHYELLDGERRLRTLKELGWTMVPVDIRDVDDRTAMRSVFKLNKIRESYTTEEEARYYKKLADEGRTAWEISQELNVNFNWVLAHLNVFKFPEEIQKAVWEGKYLTVSHMRHVLENVIERNFDEALAMASEIINRNLSVADARKIVSDRDREADEQRLEAAKQALPKVVAGLETPEDYERAAVALRAEAKKRKMEALTPEERAALEAQKEQEAMEREQRAKETLERREKARQQEIEEEARKRAEEMVKDNNFVREFVAREYVLTADDIRAEDLRDALMQKLMTNIPEEKRGRAKDIFNEEFKALQKRLEIFPGKSARFQPKLDKFETLVARGVIPYTIWDFQYRDDYAGDSDFHGNCSPQIVEQCIWRFTEEGDLVVDPMAGSGTALDVCRRFNRQCIGYDIKPPSDRADIIQNDSRNIPLESDSVDMVFIHPPYWNLVNFMKGGEDLADLSRADTPTKFLEMLWDVFRECHRTLKHGKYMCVLLGDLIRGGSFIPLCRGAANLAEETGFMDYGYAVKRAHGEESREKSKVMLVEPLYAGQLKISHDLVMFFKKDEHG